MLWWASYIFWSDSVSILGIVTLPPVWYHLMWEYDLKWSGGLANGYDFKMRGAGGCTAAPTSSHCCCCRHSSSCGVVLFKLEEQVSRLYRHQSKLKKHTSVLQSKITRITVRVVASEFSSLQFESLLMLACLQSFLIVSAKQLPAGVLWMHACGSLLLQLLLTIIASLLIIMS